MLTEEDLPKQIDEEVKKFSQALHERLAEKGLLEVKPAIPAEVSKVSKVEVDRFKRKILRIKTELDDTKLIARLMLTELSKVPMTTEASMK